MADENVERFATGAVRGTDVKARYDLIPLVGLRRLAETCAEGAGKYGENNWARGIPSSNVINHALAHIANYLDGDRTEDHLAMRRGVPTSISLLLPRLQRRSGKS
jgi:hypothetical protein